VAVHGKRVLYPDTAWVQLHLVMEQVPKSENRISLAKGRTDPFGLPLAEIAWDIAEKDHENIDRAVTQILRDVPRRTMRATDESAEPSHAASNAADRAVFFIQWDRHASARRRDPPLSIRTCALSGFATLQFFRPRCCRTAAVPIPR
jgi:hypothetical protein